MWPKFEREAGAGAVAPAKQAASLLLVLHPCLLAALALQHPDGYAPAGVEHCPNHNWALAAIAPRDRIGVEAGKDLVLKFACHDPLTRH